MELCPVHIQKEIDASDDLASLLLGNMQVQDRDIVIVAQKAISKHEGRIVRLSGVNPSLLAQGIASEYGKDSRLVELILSESQSIVRMSRGVIIVRTRNGLVCANAGIDQSNVQDGHATLLPLDPDRSARALRHSIRQRSQRDVAVIISDTFGRPFRLGQTNCAIGISGLDPILDYRGSRDSFGNVLHVTEIAVSDELCSAAELVMKKNSGCPFVVVRNYLHDPAEGSISTLSRPESEDLFV